MGLHQPKVVDSNGDIWPATSYTNDKLVSEIHTALGCTEEQTRSYIETTLDDIRTFDAKQRDYGPGNISSFGELGVLVRVFDKVSRLRNLLFVKKDVVSAANEPIEDSWKDLSVYGVIARLVRAGKWRT